jgi:hypothetical protein
MSKITKKQLKDAAKVIGEYIKQEIVSEAKKDWKNYPDIRAEFEDMGQTFDDYVIERMTDAVEDECPGGVCLEELILQF